jgi:hypothetical protein
VKSAGCSGALARCSRGLGVVLLAAMGLLASTGALAAGPVEVAATTLIGEAQAGGVGEVACQVVNATEGATVSVVIEGHVVYADGRRARLIGPFRHTLDPGTGFEVAPLFLVPLDTARGPATFQCTARVTRLEGASRRDYDPPLVATAESPFLVL